MHKCLVSIGSNYQRKENMLLAWQRLTEHFPNIHFSTEQETEPLFFSNPSLFSNQIAVFSTDAKEEEVKEKLKAIEKASGRRVQDKEKEKISLDIDLLSYDERILKPGDMERPYIIEGLRELDTLSCL